MALTKSSTERVEMRRPHAGDRQWLCADEARYANQEDGLTGQRRRRAEHFGCSVVHREPLANSLNGPLKPQPTTIFPAAAGRLGMAARIAVPAATVLSSSRLRERELLRLRPRRSSSSSSSRRERAARAWPSESPNQPPRPRPRPRSSSSSRLRDRERPPRRSSSSSQRSWAAREWPSESPNQPQPRPSAAKSVLNVIGTNWDKFSKQEISDLKTNDEQVTQIVAKYGIEKVTAQARPT